MVFSFCYDKLPCYFTDVSMPEDRITGRLRFLPKIPQFQGRPPKETKKLELIRGMEEIHTDFLHNQYGIVVSVAAYRGLTTVLC